jgi:hypothetical protein
VKQLCGLFAYYLANGGWFVAFRRKFLSNTYKPAKGKMKNGRKKTGNHFLIPCFSVPFYIAAVIQFSCEPDSVCPSVVPCLNYSK